MKLRRSPLRPFARRVRDEAGITLVEMIIGISMLTVISVPLTSAAILFARHGAEVDQRLTDDGSVRSVSSLFVTDAQTAQSAVLDDKAACGGQGSALATLAWEDAGTAVTVSWSAETIADVLVLVRRRCSDDTLVGYERVADIAAAPKISCSPSCDAPSSMTITGTAVNSAVFSFTGYRRAT